MTRKQKTAMSARMKQIWAKRKAVSAVTVTASSSNGNTISVGKTMDGELRKLLEIIELMDSLSTAGKQYLVNRFM